MQVQEVDNKVELSEETEEKKADKAAKAEKD